MRVSESELRNMIINIINDMNSSEEMGEMDSQIEQMAMSCCDMSRAKLFDMCAQICGQNEDMADACAQLCACACRGDVEGCCDCLEAICECEHCKAICAKCCGC